MLLVSQSRSNREFSEVTETNSKLNLALLIEKKNRAICKDILNKIIQLKLNDIKATIAFSVHY